MAETSTLPVVDYESLDDTRSQTRSSVERLPSVLRVVAPTEATTGTEPLPLSETTQGRPFAATSRKVIEALRTYVAETSPPHESRWATYTLSNAPAQVVTISEPAWRLAGSVSAAIYSLMSRTAHPTAPVSAAAGTVEALMDTPHLWEAVAVLRRVTVRHLEHRAGTDAHEARFRLVLGDGQEDDEERSQHVCVVLTAPFAEAEVVLDVWEAVADEFAAYVADLAPEVRRTVMSLISYQIEPTWRSQP